MSKPTPKDGILDIAPYVPGESSVSSRKASHLPLLQLAANEGALGPSPKAIQAIGQAATQTHRYPDPSAAKLRAKIGKAYGLPADRLIAGAGSDELIALLIKAYAGAGDEVLYSEHSFLMYRLSSLAASATPVAAPEAELRTSVQALFGHVTDKTKILFVANPNNPTGSYISKEEMAALHTALPSHVILAIDAAYSEFVEADDYSDGTELVVDNDNVIVLHTFSKLYGLAALRVGWAYASPTILDILHRVRGPFNVSSPAQAAAIAALDDKTHREASRQLVLEVLPWFREEIQKLGLEAPPSVGNFQLVKFGADKMEAAEVWLKDHGIIGRRIDAYGLPDYMRISIAEKAHMERLVGVIADFLQQA